MTAITTIGKTTNICVQVFVFQAIGMGAAIGILFVPTATVAVHYFQRQRGLAIGIAMSGGSFGSMIFPTRECHVYVYRSKKLSV